MNRRNAGYILPNNPRKHYLRVDDKLLTKQICESQGIPVPQTYAVIERQGDVRRFAELIGEREEFVVKPTQGSEGRGILVVARQRRQSAGSRPEARRFHRPTCSTICPRSWRACTRSVAARIES